MATASDVQCSFYFEHIVSCADLSGVSAFCAPFVADESADTAAVEQQSQQLLDIARNRCGSHVLECLLSHASRVLDGAAPDNESVVVIVAFVARLAALCVKSIATLEIDAYAAHVLKTLVRLLAGRKLKVSKKCNFIALTNNRRNDATSVGKAIYCER